MSFTYEYPRPGVTTDMVALGYDRRGIKHVLLIQRGREPWKGEWALPGGFLEMDEELEVGACREFEEETGLSVSPDEVAQVGAYGGVDRDPRMRLLTIAFTYVYADLPEAQAGDDAAGARWWPIDSLPPVITDHHVIIADAMKV
ncbi:MAG: NUDIX hydrolase [Halieaceae bacterium]|nr:NUDIX hydrolase [Halieaceae bacterium]